MKTISYPIFFLFSVLIGCNNTEKSTSTTDTKAPEKELEAVFKKMWDNVTLTNADAYFNFIDQCAARGIDLPIVPQELF